MFVCLTVCALLLACVHKYTVSMLTCLFVSAFCACAFAGMLDCSRVLMSARVREEGWKNMKGV